MAEFHRRPREVFGSRHLGADLDPHVENSSAGDEQDEVITRCTSTDSTTRRTAAPESGKYSSTQTNSETPGYHQYSTMPSIYSGALQPKKKVELQQIAEALSLATTGTKDDIQTRIKDHLDLHDLSDDPQFGGLYAAKRKTRKEEVAPASYVFQPASSL